MKLFSLYNTNQQLVLPIETEIMIPKNDSVRLLSTVLEGIDYSELYNAYSTNGRNPAISPKTLFMVLVYENLNNIHSSREIEKACKRDINFMWLLQGEKAPSYSTISRFRTGRLKKCCENLFYQFVMKLGELGEIEYKNIFIDGTKIEANSNKYSFVWKKSVDKFERKLKKKITEKVNEINEEFGKCYATDSDSLNVTLYSEIIDDLNRIVTENNVKFVSGKGKRKSKLQKYIELLYEAREKQLKYNKYNSIFDGRNSFSKTDTDATFMHLKEDHMRNSQLKPAYNLQIGVEGEYIVGVDISNERSDQLTLIPFLEKLDEKLPKKFENIVADAGYESEENYVYIEEHGQTSYIKPQFYEKQKTKKFKLDISKRENMEYDSENDEYICALGRRLKKIGLIKRTSKSGYISQVTKYECENCEGCSVKNKCTKAKGNKQIQVSKKFVEKRKVSFENITTPEGIILRMNRSIQAEGTFGVIKEDHGFRRFLLRGSVNVKIEFLLKALAYNIAKLHNKIIDNRLGCSLFIKEIL